jgi:hypothetical protein
MTNAHSQSRFDGMTVYLPKVDELMPGDILLTSNRESDDRRGMKQSDAIRRITKGNFSHAMICSAPPTFVEAIGSGVSTLSLARCFAYDIANVRLLRHPNSEIARRAAQLVQDEIGRDYSVARAVRSVFPLALLDRVDDHGIFCSALVAQVFSVAGSSLFASTPVDRTTPATIEKIIGLEDITGRAFRVGLAPRNAEEMSSLDGDRVPTPSAKQTMLSAKCAKAIWPQAHAVAAKYPELALAPGATFSGLLRFVTDSCDKVNDLPEAKHDIFKKDILAIDEALESFVLTGELKGVLLEIANLDDATILRNLHESFQDDADIDLDAMKSYYNTSRSQLETRLKAIGNWEQWGLHRSKAMSAYIEIDRMAAEATRNRKIILREILERRGVRFQYESIA